ncbi:hypothetical protein [Leptolyngbya subtilissima]
MLPDIGTAPTLWKAAAMNQNSHTAPPVIQEISGRTSLTSL